ncbi:GNAT family N-acetyltransferase [Crenalkalicoccus roseus]|uniref:GNAT family N-acetyltransferase n=1 Tax=Crenalkalicoccus roseus TaxID=1485588 RepID=UPI0010811FF3|nr:GNAT family N-acetyltransferase [Crenalkalicoccus roseus]
MRWRPMRAADLAAVGAIAARLHAGHPESPAVFAERLALAPEGCRVLAGPEETVRGYALTHPWRAAAPPPLDALLGALPAAPDAWHIHDVALLPEARGAGHVAALLRALDAAAAARGLGWATLVALAGAAPYWRRHGFREAAASGAGAAALASYGAGARLMRRPLR